MAEHICACCQSPFIPVDDVEAKWGRKKYCTKACARKADRLRASIRGVEHSKQRTIKAVVSCRWCCSEFSVYQTTGRYGYFCSNRCAALDRGAKRRAARKYSPGKRYPWSLVRKAAIWKRDQYKCQLCGGLLDMDTPWNPHDPPENYPTIDHVIPIVHGGLDTPPNVQAAHWKCNVLKGDALLPNGEQLRLVG